MGLGFRGLGFFGGLGLRVFFCLGGLGLSFFLFGGFRVKVFFCLGVRKFGVQDLGMSGLLVVFQGFYACRLRVWGHLSVSIRVFPGYSRVFKYSLSNSNPKPPRHPKL